MGYLWRGQARGIRNSDSGLALLVEVDDVTVWVPHAAIHEDSEVWRPGDKGDLVIPQEMAEKKGLC